MIALLVYVIIGVAVLILSPILFAAFGLYMIIAVGLVFGGIHLALYILDILTLEGLFVSIGLGVGNLVLKSASNNSLTNKKPFSGSSVRNRTTSKKPKQIDETYTSVKLELRKKFLELKAAFSENSKIRKIQGLNSLERQRKSYSEECIEKAIERLQQKEIQLIRFLNEGLEKYLNAGVVSLSQSSKNNDHASFLDQRSLIYLYFGNEELRHMEIELKVRPISPEKQNETINVRFQQYGRGEVKSITAGKLLRLIKKDLIQYLKTVPKLAEKINAS